MDLEEMMRLTERSNFQRSFVDKQLDKITEADIEWFKIVFNPGIQIPSNYPTIVRAHFLKQKTGLLIKTCIIPYQILRNVPFIRMVKNTDHDIKNYASSNDLFQDFSNEYITKEVYPYLDGHVEWGLKFFGRVLERFYNGDFLFELILEDCLKELEKKSMEERVDIVNLLETKYRDNSRFRYPKTMDKIVLRFPELKFRLLDL